MYVLSDAYATGEIVSLDNAPMPRRGNASRSAVDLGA